MCVFSLYFKALDRKGVCKVFQNNFLFDNWQQFKSIMRKKKGTNSLSKLLTCSSQTTCICWWVGVCLCLRGSTAHRLVWAVFHAHLQGSEATVSEVVEPKFLLGNYSFDSKLSFSLPLPLSKLLPNSQVFCLNKRYGYKSCPPFKIHWEIETA